MNTFRVMPTPRSVDIAITGRCNLKCQYCFYADEMETRSDLSAERWLTFFEELGRLGVMDATLSGGEVFTRRDIFELIDGIIANRMRYGMLSNGTLITEKVLARFDKGKRRLRLNSIQVSIDGSCAEIHNQSRPDSFDKALRGLRLLKKNGFPVTVRVTINRHNVDDLKNIAALLLEDVGLPGFSTNEAFPMGSGKCSGGSIILTREQRQQAMDTLTALNERYEGRISAQAGPLSLAKEWADIEARMARGETAKPGRGTLASCGGVFKKLDIQHDGTIVPCNLLPDLTMGKIIEDDLQQAWLDHPSINIVRQRRTIPTRSLLTCKDCAYAGFCNAGCPGMVMNINDRLNARDPMVCFRIQRGEEAYASV
ncbi:radical SAM protein [Desulfococcaceae bacterium HSG9]|nr:radical SAM protein [Desulfococcaceae bacterium HSG9]